MYTVPSMTTPQQPARRLKQKRRRTKQLAQWRAKAETTTTAPTAAKATAAPKEGAAKAAKPADAKPAKKTAAKTA